MRKARENPESINRPAVRAGTAGRRGGIAAKGYKQNEEIGF